MKEFVVLIIMLLFISSMSRAGEPVVVKKRVIKGTIYEKVCIKGTDDCYCLKRNKTNIISMSCSFFGRGESDDYSKGLVSN